MRRFAISPKFFPRSTTSSSAAAFVTHQQHHQQIRSIVVFSQQNPALLNANLHGLFKSNVWVEDEDVNTWITPQPKNNNDNVTMSLRPILTKLKDSEKDKFVSCQISKMLDFYNLDCIDDEGAMAKEAEETLLEKARIMSKYEDQKNYSQTSEEFLRGSHIRFGNNTKRFRGEEEVNYLDSVCAIRGYSSKIWISAYEVRSRRCRLARGSKPTHLVFPNVAAKLWNAEQFEQPEAILKTPILGYRRKPAGPDFAAGLIERMKQRNFSSPLFFSREQMDFYDLMSQLKQDEEPVSILPPPPNNHNNNAKTDAYAINQKYYNICDVENVGKYFEFLKQQDIVMNNKKKTPQQTKSNNNNNKNTTDKTGGFAVVRKDVVDFPHFFMSARPISRYVMAEYMMEFATQNGFTNHYWLTSADIEKISGSDKSIKLKEGAKCFDLDQIQSAKKAALGERKSYQFQRREFEKVAVEFYNVEQLENPNVGFEIAGTRAMF